MSQILRFLRSVDWVNTFTWGFVGLAAYATGCGLAYGFLYLYHLIF